jgi:hypothetical protein
VDVIGLIGRFRFAISKTMSGPAIGGELSLSNKPRQTADRAATHTWQLSRLPSPPNEGAGRFQVARLLEQVHRIDERLYHPERERDADEGPR